MAEQKSGISRAIAIAGNQSALSRLIWEKFRVHVWQSRISEYERVGYAAPRNAELISAATGVPLADLIRTSRRARRLVANKAGSGQ